jgi:hypothetical protein
MTIFHNPGIRGTAGFLAGLGIWLLAFVVGFLALSFLGRGSLIVCPLVLAVVAIVILGEGKPYSAFSVGMVIAVCLGVLLSSICGVQISGY